MRGEGWELLSLERIWYEIIASRSLASVTIIAAVYVEVYTKDWW
jgi:hypothetical protein